MLRCLDAYDDNRQRSRSYDLFVFWDHGDRSRRKSVILFPANNRRESARQSVDACRLQLRNHKQPLSDYVEHAIRCAELGSGSKRHSNLHVHWHADCSGIYWQLRRNQIRVAGFKIKTPVDYNPSMRSRRLKLTTVFGSAVVVLALAFGVSLLTGMRLSVWQSSPSPAVMKVTTATMPAPNSANGQLTSTTTSSTSTSSYPASSHQQPYTVYGSWSTVGCAPNAGQTECTYQCSLNGQTANNLGNPPSPPSSYACSKTDYTTVYDCPNGGSLSGITCYVTTTSTSSTPSTIKFTWSETYTGPFLVPDIQVVEANSCTSTNWTPIATESDSSGSYTVNSPSSSEYYAIRTINNSWIGPTTSCTQG